MDEKSKLKEIFGQIRAEEELKKSTKDFIEKKTRGYTVAGDARRRYGMFAAACFCFFFVVLGGHWFYFTPTTRISIDINPSIELDINRFGRVVSVNGYNDDGRELLDALDIKFLRYEDAIERILENERIKVLLAGDEVMVITVTGDDGTQSGEIFSGIEACTAQRRNMYCYFASEKEVGEAHEAGLSYGKYRAFLELLVLDPDITVEDVQGMTMREIRDLAENLSSGGTDHTPPDHNRGHGQHGYGGGYGGGRGKERREE